MQTASTGVESITRNVAEIASVTKTANESVRKVKASSEALVA
jgi:methyl-accepting chemotaxis protein